MISNLAAGKLQFTTSSGVRIAVFVLAYFVACWACQQLMIAPALGVALWPAGGLLLAMLVRAGPGFRFQWIVLAIATEILASITLFQFPVQIAAPVAVGNAVEAWAGAVMLQRTRPHGFEFHRTADAAAFTAVCCLAPISSMLLGGTAVAWHTQTPLFESWRLWWTGDALGLLVVAPLLLSVPPCTQKCWRASSIWSLADWLAIFGAAVILGSLCLGHEYPIAFATLPLVVWAAIRHGVVGSSFASGLIVVEAVIFAAAGRGPFVGHLSNSETQFAVQGFGIVTALTGLALAVAITETRHLKDRAESEVERKTAELRLRERDLRDAMRNLEEVDSRKDRFLLNLAHELLNPISPLRNGLTLLNSDLPAERLTGVRSMMSRQLDHLLSLVVELYDLARIKAGKLRLDPVTLSAGHIVHCAAEQVEERIRAKHQTLTMDVPSQVVNIVGDRKRLIQVVANLLTNACNHCPEASSILVRLTHDSEVAFIEVIDNGPGIPLDQVGRLLNPFEQMTTDGEGMGLGLALVNQLIEMHDGRFDVQSELGVGTSFKISLKRAAGSASPSDDA